MKKTIALIITMFLIVMIAGCNSVSVTKPVDTTEPTPEPTAEIKGEVYETEKFSLTVVTGWEKMDITGGIQIYKALTGEILQVQVIGHNVTEAEDKALLEALASTKNGTPLELLDLLGMKFYKTTFTASAVEQTYFSGVRNGEQVKIQITGKDFQDNKDINAMFNTLKLK